MKHEPTPTQSSPAGLSGIFGQAYASIAYLAPPSLAQFALRFALAVPFWRSGINKWDGFLQLNDVAILLFSSEFRLHLPGDPTPTRFPRPSPSHPAWRKSSFRFCWFLAWPPAPRHSPFWP